MTKHAYTRERNTIYADIYTIQSIWSYYGYYSINIVRISSIRVYYYNY
jgi:hypothetical protein